MIFPNKCPMCLSKSRMVNKVFSVGPVLSQVTCGCGMSGPVQYDEDSAAHAWNQIEVKRTDVIKELTDRQEADRGRDF